MYWARLRLFAVGVMVDRSEFLTRGVLPVGERLWSALADAWALPPIFRQMALAL